MTGLLASVRSPAEAELALAGGADIIDLKDPDHGALAALPAAVIAEAAAWARGRVTLSATAGDLPMRPGLVAERVNGIAALGVDFVKIALLPEGDRAGCLAALAGLAARGRRIVVVLFADRVPELSLVDRVAEAGLAGIMLDTADKAGGGLRRHLDQAFLAAFVGRARARGLLTGLAGSLRREDVPSLLPLGADYLGFRGALCAAGRSGSLDPAALAAIRTALGRTQGTASSAATAAAGA
jgi:uncharacterized protein (UPF0264 family)